MYCLYEAKTEKKRNEGAWAREKASENKIWKINICTYTFVMLRQWKMMNRRGTIAAATAARIALAKEWNDMRFMFKFIVLCTFRAMIRFRKHFTVSSSICCHIIQLNRFIFIETMLKFEFLFARMMISGPGISVFAICTASAGGIAIGAERNLCLMLNGSEFPARRTQWKLDVHILLVTRCRHTLR